MRKTTLSVLMVVVITLQAAGQEPEWLMRIPKYLRLKGGSSQFVVDHKRNGILFDGGSYDTYFTTDLGKTWKTIFEDRMFFADIATHWQIDDEGRWLFTGNVYKKIPVNIITEDAGDSFRWLFEDAFLERMGHRWEVPIRMYRPNVLFADVHLYGIEGVGYLSSCDGGRNWSTFVDSIRYQSQGTLNEVEPNRIQIDGPEWQSREYDPCTGSMELVGHRSTSRYYRMGDGTIVQTEVRGQPNPKIYYFHPQSTDTTTISEVFEPTSKKTLPVQVHESVRVNDTLALFFCRYGIIIQYTTHGGFTIVDIPPYTGEYTAVSDAGMYKNLILLATQVPEGDEAGSVRYTVINVSTGSVHTYRRVGPICLLPVNYSTHMVFSAQRLIPISDSLWWASPTHGELLWTSNAGATWQLFNDIPRNPQWGDAWIGVKRLFVTGSEQMAALTEFDKLLYGYGGRENWHVAVPRLFTHKITLPSNYRQAFTRSPITFGEDRQGDYRFRFGPSSILFQSPTTIWTSGDALCAFSLNGEFIDTILHRPVRFIKRVDTVIVVGMHEVFYTFNEGKEWHPVGDLWPSAMINGEKVPAAIGDITRAANGNLVAGLRGTYIIDTNGVERDSLIGGITISTNNGRSWLRTSSGIDPNAYVTSLFTTRNGTLLAIASKCVVDPRLAPSFVEWGIRPDPSLFANYARLSNTYIYRSTDHGRTWTFVRNLLERPLLPETEIRFVSMPDGRVMAVHPMYGIEVSNNNGVTWVTADPLNIGVPVINDIVFTDDGYAHIATNEGYVRLRIENIVKVSEQPPVAGTLRVHKTHQETLMIHAEQPPTQVRVFTLDGSEITNVVNPDGVREVALSLARGVYIIVATTGSAMQSALIQW